MSSRPFSRNCSLLLCNLLGFCVVCGSFNGSGGFDKLGNLVRSFGLGSLGNFGNLGNILGSVVGLCGRLVIRLILCDEQRENEESENNASDNCYFIESCFLGSGLVALVIRTAVAAGDNAGHAFFAVLESDKHDNCDCS